MVCRFSELDGYGKGSSGVICRALELAGDRLSELTGIPHYYVGWHCLRYGATKTATNSYVWYYHNDCRGSTVALTDHESRVTDWYEYSAYGTLTYRIGTTDTPFLYNGRFGVQTDPNGLLYMRARYYNPYICRFINPDPIGFAGGLNWYMFADGNPVNYLDPFGLRDWGKVLQGSLEVAGGILAAFLVGLAEAPSAGAVSVAIPTIFLGITHGMTTIGVGLQPDPTTPEQQRFLDIYPSGPGELIGMTGYAFGPAVGQKTETIGGLVWDLGSFASSTFGVFNAFANGERMALPLTQFGLDAANLFSSEMDAARLFFPAPNQTPTQSLNVNAGSRLFQDSFSQTSSTGK